MTRVDVLEWRNEQLGGNFPFADNASLLSTSGLLQLLSDTFLDGHLYPIGNDGGLFIPLIDVTASRVTIYIGTFSTHILASASFNPLDPPDVLQFSDTYGRPAGVLLTDELGLAAAQTWPIGSHVFSQDATAFVASICVPMPEIGLRGFQLPDGTIVTGDVWIVGENGVVVREDPDEVIADGHVVRIDLVGDPLFVRRLCGAVIDDADVPLFTPKKFIKTINGVSSDEFGNIRINVGTGLVEDPVLRIIPTASGLLWMLVGQKSGN